VKNKWMLVTGIGLGLIAVILVNVYLSQHQRSFTLLKVSRPLSQGEQIGAGVLVPTAVPENFGSVLSEAVRAADREWVVGKVLVQDISPVDFLQYSHIARSPDEDFDRRLDKDKRALALQVSEETGVGGFLEPGSFVDIIATMIQPGDAEHPNGRIATKGILQKVKILAVGDRVLRTRSQGPRRDRRGMTTVTLELTPLQAEKVIFAQQHAEGPLRLALVHPESSPAERGPAVSWENFDDIR
jgi:pilus assembly protein CpaB